MELTPKNILLLALTVLAVMALALTFALSGSSDGSADGGPDIVVAEGGSASLGSVPDGPDKNLATIELEHTPDVGDSTLTNITALLDQLQPICTANDRTQLSDFVANSMRLVEDESEYSVVPTQILEDAATASGAWHDPDCAGLFVSLVSEYQAGMN